MATKNNSDVTSAVSLIKEVPVYHTQENANIAFKKTVDDHTLVINEAINKCKAIVVTDEITAKLKQQSLTDLNKGLIHWEGMRKDFGAPYRNSVTFINAVFSPGSELLETEIKLVKKDLDAWDKKETERKRQEAIEAAAKAKKIADNARQAEQELINLGKQLINFMQLFSVKLTSAKTKEAVMAVNVEYRESLDPKFETLLPEQWNSVKDEIKNLAIQRLKDIREGKSTDASEEISSAVADIHNQINETIDQNAVEVATQQNIAAVEAQTNLLAKSVIKKRTTLKWSVNDINTVPRSLLIVNSEMVEQFKKANEEVIKQALTLVDADGNIKECVIKNGIKFFLETNTIS